MNYYCDVYIHSCQNEGHEIYGDLNLYMSTPFKDLEINIQQLSNILHIVFGYTFLEQL